ncbi:MAG: hypothetical protein JO136_16770 [Hyphomicrobiales bacterium]|nr:hypothetical protein [Hyphomicrobiales bacterium]
MDEEGFDVAELEKLSSSVQPADGSSSIEPVLFEQHFWSPQVRREEESKRRIRADLDEEEFDLAELEKLKRLVNPEGSDHSSSIEPVFLEELSWAPVTGRAEESKRPVRINSDHEGFDLAELEKLKELVDGQGSGESPSIEPLFIEELYSSSSARWAEHAPDARAHGRFPDSPTSDDLALRV